MDFGDILDSWEKETSQAYGKKKMAEDLRSEKNKENLPSGRTNDELPQAHPIDIWLRHNGIQDKDSDIEGSRHGPPPAERRRRLLAMKAEATIDLHGLTRDDAWARLEVFFADCLGKDLKKVLIIHGKGSHSVEAPVLKKTVSMFLEKHPNAGESGSASKDAGGSGATWVILK